MKKENYWHYVHFDTRNNEYAHNKLLKFLNDYDVSPEKCKIIKTGVGVTEEYDLYYIN